MTPTKLAREQTRTDVAKHVHRRLADREFASRLVKNPETGHSPVLIALLEDPMTRVLEQAEHLGGAVNMFVPVQAGTVVVGLESLPHVAATATGTEAAEVSQDCSVGVFVEQLGIWSSDSSVVRFVNRSAPRRNGQAKIVAFA